MAKRMSQYRQLAGAANAVSMLSPPTPEEIAAEEAEADMPPYIEDDEEEEEEEEDDNDEDREATGELDEPEEDGYPDEWWLRPLPAPHGIDPSPSPLAKKQSKPAAKASPPPSAKPSPSPSPSPVAFGPGKCGCTVSELVNQLVDTPIPKLSTII